jgi:hypothetical protein
MAYRSSVHSRLHGAWLLSMLLIIGIGALVPVGTIRSSAGSASGAHSGDHLHPNDAGYQAMANAIDLRLFEHWANAVDLRLFEHEANANAVDLAPIAP